MASCDNEFIPSERLKEYKGLQIIHMNTRSIHPKIDELRHRFLIPSMDILCVTESWLNNQIPDNMINILGYSILRNDRQHKKGGGTCIYINQRLQYIECMPNLSQAEVEIQSVILSGNGNMAQSFRPIVIILIYRPPQGNHNKALDMIKHYVHSIPDISKKEVVILGDLNWNYLDTNLGWKYINELELEFSIKQIITVPTRYCPNKASLIDVILTNMNNILVSGCLDTSFSDHYPIFVVKKRKKILRKFEYKTARSYKYYDSDLLKNRLTNLDWSVFDLLTDVDDMWNMIQEAIKFELDRMCPIKEIKVNTSKPEWFNNTLYEIARDRDRLFRKYRQGKRKNLILYQEAVKKRKAFSKLFKTAREEYFQEQLLLNQNNALKYWSIISDIIGQSSVRKIDQVFLYGTKVLCDEPDAANIINEFFSTVGERVSKDLGHLPYVQLDDKPDLELANFPLMSVADFVSIASELKTNKPSGILDFSATSVIDSMFALPELYTKLCNYSLIEGKFPTSCKTARISIIPKKGDSHCLDNLRPISILSIIGKILEKFVKNIIVNYFEENDLFYHLQFGFRTGRSTIDAVYYLVDKILKNKNVGLYTSVAFLDLTKAFNCVHHGLLLEKLSHYGLKGTVLNWFKTYLSNRKQFTRLDKDTNVSDTVEVASGVPQGSVLGPILYLIYINDIGNNNVYSDILMFADDSVLIKTSNHIQENCKKLECDLKMVSDYFKRLKLGLNVSKTKIMHFDKCFKRCSLSNVPNIMLNGVDVVTVTSFKYLGIWIDNKLKFSVHLDACVKNACHKIYMLRKIRNCINVRTASTIYKTMILPIIEYGNIFLLSCTSAEITKIQCIQNKGLKVAFNRDRRYSTRLLHKEANLASWEVRSRISANRLMFKYKFNTENLEECRSGTRLQSGPLFKVERPKSKSFINSLSYKIRVLWNELPASLRNIDDQIHFNLATKRFHVTRFFEDN